MVASRALAAVSDHPLEASQTLAGPKGAWRRQIICKTTGVTGMCTSQLCILEGSTEAAAQLAAHDLAARCYVDMIDAVLKLAVPAEDAMEKMVQRAMQVLLFILFGLAGG